MEGPFSVFSDLSNKQIREDASDGRKDFSRRPKPVKASVEESAHTVESEAEERNPYELPPELSPLTDAGSPPAKGRKKARQRKGKPGYNRKLATTAAEQEEAKRKAFIAAKRAHFAEIDAFEMTVETDASSESELEPDPDPEDARKPESIPEDLPQPPSNRRTSAPAPLQESLGESSSRRLPQLSGPAVGVAPTSEVDPQSGAVSPADRGEASLRRRLSFDEDEQCSTRSGQAPRASSSAGGDQLSEAGQRTNATREDEATTDEEQLQSEIDKAAGSRRLDGIHAKGPMSAQRPSAYGLSRRSSICFAESAISESYPRRARQKSLLGPHKERLETISAVPRQQSLLSRVSTGLSNAFHRLTLATSGGVESPREPASRPADTLQDEPLSERVRESTVEPPGCSPIVESPEPGEASPLHASHTREEATEPSSPEVCIPGTPSTVAADQTPEPRAKSPLDAQSPAVASIAAALKDRLQLDGTPSPRHAASPAREAPEHLSHLQQLLRVCNQSTDERSIPSMRALLERHVDLSTVRKIGEGTFGEAFKAEGVVFKIVPLEGQTPVNGESQKRADEILGEVAIALTLSQLRSPQGDNRSNITSGFVETHGVGICRGEYDPALVAEWHDWDEKNDSENDPVNIFPADQLYVVFVVADGGADLERFEIRNFEEGKAILFQCAMILAVAEEACGFEHRDLHWGNVLVRREATQTAAYRLRDVDLELQTEGVVVTIIDFTLSRLQTLTGDVAFCNLEADPELFQGPKNDCQAETYRRMRKATKGDWQRHVPSTNALWMHYLADLLLTKKQVHYSSRQKRELRDFRKRAAGYKACVDLILDDLFCEMWQTTEQ